MELGRRTPHPILDPDKLENTVGRLFLFFAGGQWILSSLDIRPQAEVAVGGRARQSVSCCCGSLVGPGGAPDAADPEGARGPQRSGPWPGLGKRAHGPPVGGRLWVVLWPGGWGSWVARRADSGRDRLG